MLDTIVFLHIPYSQCRKLHAFSQYKAYTSRFQEKIQAYRFALSDPRYTDFCDYIAQQNIPYTLFRKEHLFSPTDYENATFLRVIFDREVDPFLATSVSPPCPHCHSFDRVPLPSVIQKPPIDASKTDFFSAYLNTEAGGDQWFVTDKAANILKELELGEACLIPIDNTNIYLLKPAIGIGPCIPPTEIEAGPICPHCGRPSFRFLKSPLYLNTSTHNGTDIFISTERFGDKSPLNSPCLIATQKAYQRLKLFSDLSFEPCF